MQTRQKKFGENIFSKKADPSWAVVLLRQFYSPLIISLVIAFSFKEIDLPLFKYPLFDNKLLLVGVIGGLVALLSTLYVPLLQTVFGTLPLSPWLLLLAVIWCLFTVAWIEFMKWIFNSYSKKLKKYIPLLSRS